jgi:hypothetical protein
VAIIEDALEIARIIDWAKKQEKGSPLTVCARSSPKLTPLSVKALAAASIAAILHALPVSAA